MELTTTEYQVAELVTKGYSEKEIASKLFVSPKTVHNHTYNIRKRNNLRSCVDIAREFILSLENPKQYFAAIVLLLVQSFSILESIDFECRKLNNINRIVRVSRVGRRQVS